MSLETPSAEVAAPVAATETPAIEGVEAVTSDDNDFSKRFAALARRERGIMTREQKITESEKEATAARQEAAEVRELLATFKKNPRALMAKTGMTFNEIAQAFLHEGEPEDPVTKLSAEVESLRVERQQDIKQAEERKNAEEQASLEKENRTVKESIQIYEEDAKEFIATAKSPDGSDRYELIKYHDAIEQVYEVVYEYWNQTFQKFGPGKAVLLSPEAAADVVEKQLEDQAKGILNLKRFAPPASSQRGAMREPPTQTVREASRPVTTLTNGHASAHPAASSSAKLTREQRLAKASERLAFTK